MNTINRVQELLTNADLPFASSLKYVICLDLLFALLRNVAIN